MYTILAIEDDPKVRKLFQKALTAEGYGCLVAENAAAGLEKALQNKPDLVVLDVNLPDGNGIEVCRRIKSDPKLRHIPVIIVTGEARSLDNRVDGLESGADDYILKPFGTREILSRVRAILKDSIRPTER